METNYIYKIINNQNFYWYVGYTNNPKRRWRDHKRTAKKGEDNSKFYNAMRKHGIDQFEFYVCETVSSAEEAKYREKELIAEFSPEYNSTAGGDGMCNPTDEVRKRLSEGIRNSPKNEGRLNRAWDTRRAEVSEEEWSKIMSQAQANMTPEAKEHKSKMLSLAQAARSPEKEAERQRKRAETVSNWSTEQKESYSAKITEHNLTRVLTEEAKQRIAEGQVIGGHLTGQLMKKRLAAMSTEEYEARNKNLGNKIREGRANESPEKKAERERKRLASYLATRARNKAAKLAAEQADK